MKLIFTFEIEEIPQLKSLDSDAVSNNPPLCIREMDILKMGITLGENENISIRNKY